MQRGLHTRFFYDGQETKKKIFYSVACGNMKEKMENLDFVSFFLQLTVKLASGAIGPPVLSLAVVAPKKGQGSFFNFLFNSYFSIPNQRKDKVQLKY